MKTKHLFFMVMLFGVGGVVKSQVVFSETKYQNTLLTSVVLESKYAPEVLEEGLKTYMDKQGATTSRLFSFNFSYKVYKNIKLAIKVKDSVPYSVFNFGTKIETQGLELKKRTLLTFVVLDNKGGFINFEKHKVVLDYAKTWVEQFGDYFMKTFVPEKEIRLAKQGVIDGKKLYEQTLKDSAETMLSIQKKILFHETELKSLYDSQKNQGAFFSYSINLQKKRNDSLQNNLDSLQKAYLLIKQKVNN